MDMPTNEADCKVEFDCTDNMATATDEEIAYGMAFFGTLFTDKGLNFLTFVKDTKKVYDAICV
jgi:hypothetical protein